MDRKLLVLALISAVAPSFACGPDFPPDLLSSRESNMLDLPDGTFAFEAGRLLVPADAMRARTVDRWSESEAIEPGLDAEQLKLIEQMRATANIAEAQALAADLPRELELYTLGAVAWHLGDHTAAQQYFEQVLALPAEKRKLRSVWAAYMLGRLALLNGDIDVGKGHFENTRNLRLAGFSDAKDLALAGYGEVAGYYLRAGDFVSAIALYAEQAARGDESGRASLLLVARQMLRNPDHLPGAIADPLVQKLLGAYVYTRSGDLLQTNYDDNGEPIGPAPPTDPATALERVLAALDNAGIKEFSGADRLAAGAYRVGKFAIAARFAALQQTPLAAWVRAKLALRDGENQLAAAALAEAAKGFATNESWDDANQYLSYPLKPQCRVQAEQGVLQLARGEYLAAAEHLFAADANYWADLAYVAERVLSAKELLQLTSKVAPKYLPPKPSEDSAEAWYTDPSIANRLRYLTARRLLREGKWEAALNWFDTAKLQPLAREYAAAMAVSGDPLKRAEALSQAADLARKSGMELLGYEGDPDYRIYDGAYDFNDSMEYDEQGEPIRKPRADLKIAGKFVGPQEAQRVAQTKPEPLARFHYRQLAAQHALNAAKLVPARSQAFAALLCKATAYVNVRTPELGLQIYQRYLREGAFVPWGQAFGRGDSFGSACPAPNFARVAEQLNAARVAKLKRLAKLSAWPVLGAILLGIGALVWRRKARKT